MHKTPVPLYFDHDGAVDDLLSLVLLCGFPQLKLLGVGVTPADCILEPALTATLKLLEHCNYRSIPVSGGILEVKNGFPEMWRDDSTRTAELNVIRSIATSRRVIDTPAHLLLGEVLRSTEAPVTLLFTGPLTNLAAALDEAPDIEAQIHRLYWMGGALSVPGNVMLPSGLSPAEWNVYADPAAAKRVWMSRIPITLVPLDATNCVPVTKKFVSEIGERRQSPLAEILWQLWTYAATGEYYLWDTLTTLLAAHPELAEYEEVTCDIIVEGREEGRTALTPHGRTVLVPKNINPNMIYSTVLRMLEGKP